MKTNSILFFSFFSLFFFLFFVNSFAQYPDWSWAKSTGSISNDESKSITVDINGNSYVSGYFSSTITFGTTTLTSVGGYDIFVVKYDASGNVLWAKSGGGISTESSTGICVDSSGNVYVIGDYQSHTITFGTTTLTNNSNGDDWDFFVVKYNAFGNLIWAKSFGSIITEGSSSCTVDVYGNIYITGLFSSYNISFGSTTLTNSGYVDVFVVKINALGNVIWAKREGGAQYDNPSSITTDAIGNVYLTGFFSSPTITFGTTTLTNSSLYGDIFIVKYNTSGSVLWAKREGDSKSDYISNLSFDAIGNFYIVGNYYSPSLTFGTNTLTNADPTGNTSDIYIVKYDASGNVLWAKSAGRVKNDNVANISVASNGDSYVTGYFKDSTISFGTHTLTNINPSSSYSDIFVVKYNASGNVVWTKSVGGSKNDCVARIYVDGSGSAYITGWFDSPNISFGSTLLINTGLGDDIFISKLDNFNVNINDFQDKLDDIMIFPNPVNNELTIETITNSTIEIINLEGQIFNTLSTSSTKTIIDISRLPSGVYILKIKTDNGINIKKIIKQ